ncbi:MAG TPA: GNAT family N-acetyltransferase [Terriglobales bacterium]|nr:GNAT family N-acetyltransferase [Terriglobales bacterium]
MSGSPQYRAVRRASSAAASVTLREPQANEMERYYDLRWRVLREPWSQQRGQERDQHETGAIHLGAWADDRLVGVGRLHFIDSHTAQIRYMAVEPELQGQGIGGRLLQELEERARERGTQRIVLNARDRAVNFYRNHGYSVTHSSEVLFNSIPHWEMEKLLATRLQR